ncbi:MAG TPA: AarF/ABC1/UbiB kinase family protein [Thermodesulfovibrionales bacterium]|nr:AarF/ABC1/UbiB kinase family protein [Thermodesulfovibrionales bacterium]
MPFSFLRLRKSANRIRQIINVFLKYGFGKVIDQIHLGRFIPFRKRIRAFGQWPPVKSPSAPEQLRMAFAELGPSFIKLAQILSTRPDLITPRFADEFKKLQDRVPPFPAEEAFSIIEDETGKKIEEIFSAFDRVPVAAASIAQVFQGTLLDGRDVIIKVQRPRIREQIETDIDILMYAASLLEKYLPESNFFNPTGIVDEFSKTVKKELDFIEESRNCMRFRKNFENVPDVYIPDIFTRFTTNKIIVMERIEGVRIDDIEGIVKLGLDRPRLAKAGVNAYFKMTLEDGFFHADPHAGNIFAMPSGKIGFMDFGIVGRVSPELRETMANTFLALINKDFDRLIDQYIELGLVPEHIDPEAFRKGFKADLSDFLEPLYGMTIKEINFAEYLDTVTHLAIKHKMKIPSDLLLINKAMLILENIGRELDPDFDFIAVAEPYASKIVRERLRPGRLYEKARKNVMEVTDFAVLFPRQMRQIVQKVLKDDFHIKMTHIGMDRLIRDMDRSSNRIAFGMIISAILLSSAIMHATGAGPTILGFSLLGLSAFFFALVMGFWLIISIIRSGRL